MPHAMMAMRCATLFSRSKASIFISVAKEDVCCGSGPEPRRLNAHDQRIPVRRVGQSGNDSAGKVWSKCGPCSWAIALVLLVESLGVHYGATRFDITYLDRNKAIPAANAIAGEKATNLLVVDSSQEGVSDAEAMLDQILLDMKVPTTTVDVA